MESERIHLNIVSHPKNLEYIRGMIADITALTPLAEKDSESIILAVDEACSNIIKHSYKNDYTRKIDLTIQLETDALTISILDDGIEFDIESIAPRDITDIRQGGLGIHIIKQVMDTLEYGRNKKGLNTVKMTKNLLP